jgi:hypothetical protein
MLSLEEAEARAQASAKELEEMLDSANEIALDEHAQEKRHEYFTAHFMSLLAETYGIAAPPETEE